MVRQPGKKTMKHNVKLEIRESREGPRLHAQLIQEGRAAKGGRRELFTLNSLIWPDNGIGIKVGHQGQTVLRAAPTRSPNGEIRIAPLVVQEIVDAVAAGQNRMSIEFKSLREVTTRGGVREIQRAYLDAAALVANPEYHETAAEVRSRRDREKFYRWL